MKQLLVSVVIVDYKADIRYLVEALEAIERQKYRYFEVVVVHDKEIETHTPSISPYLSGRNQPPFPLNVMETTQFIILPSYSWLRVKGLGKKMGAADKRDIGVKMARGEIIAFLDDDAFPEKHWLGSLVEHYKNPHVAGVGGPGVTPPDVPFMEAASGWMNASPLGSGPYGYRFLPGKRMEVDDYPSMNLSVRKKDFESVGGFDSHYWPGEDTKLCLDLVHHLGKKIIYEPQAMVYHHRRPLWKAHLRQNGNFGLHRGYFAKALPQTSLRLSYFLPSLMVLGIAYLVLGSWFRFLRVLYLYEIGLVFLGLYFLALIVNGMWVWRKSGSLLHGVFAIISVWVTQVWYGVRFAEGLLLKRQLSR